ncbi:hypothetical protein F4803DRAFT_551869 [Xylaria telfairii]|nr:hypothetical protein F4803DRAFT_551869 [Xylaria telfairii]
MAIKLSEIQRKVTSCLDLIHELRNELRATTERCTKLEAHLQVSPGYSSTLQLLGLQPESSESKNQANSVNDTAGSSEDPRRKSITAYINEVLPAEREALAKQVADYLLPQIKQAIASATEREVNKPIKAASSETPREKIQAILTRIEELSEDELKTLFLRSAGMTRALQTVVRTIQRY